MTAGKATMMLRVRVREPRGNALLRPVRHAAGGALSAMRRRGVAAEIAEETVDRLATGAPEPDLRCTLAAAAGRAARVAVVAVASRWTGPVNVR